ncbi:outer membrane biogenesis protein BamB [Rubripirellula tenax]|uniref:Outer membrane biogenesis protein BamB n=1 Tax=Rubripirellula tenax TaxID=2528015 RepID=A0A5C6FAV0_9BACT|nr:PQQ-binding-like beta-propeller repeat protein [Rubripirellula tenax]TWU58528.1 outer membrane biogenesis protein BamB [Rubripirellula tenax]
MNLHSRCSCLFAGFVAVGIASGLVGALPVGADDWAQFLGPTRDGTSSEVELADSLDNVRVAWRVPGGVGMSAVAVADGKAITMYNEGNSQLLVAMSAQTGNKIWNVSVGPAYENGQGDGPRATPTISGGMVYAMTGNGWLAAVSLDTGKLKWKTDIFADGGKASEYGMSSSPLVVGSNVIVHANTPSGTVIGFDAENGDKVWAAASGAAGYSSPTLLEIGGVKRIVSFTGTAVYGIDPSDGRVLWSYPFKTPYDCNTASPINVDGGVFISAGENHGCVLLDIKNDGGNDTVTERWSSVDTKSVMRNEWQTSVVVDGYLYGFDNVGSAGPTTHLSCIRASTGETVWSETRFGKGNLTLADGKLWITTMKGELVLVKVSPEGYQELGRKRLFATTRQSLSIADGHGYIRDDTEIICLRLK